MMLRGFTKFSFFLLLIRTQVIRTQAILNNVQILPLCD